jgi:Pyrimidine dimer DNA glycosylase
MNIFALSSSPNQAAVQMLDKHVVKMCTETGQLLSTAYLLAGGKPFPELYKPSHANHPSTKWTLSSYENFLWLLEHFDALNSEYMFRYNKTQPHATYAKLFKQLEKHVHEDMFIEQELTPVYLAMKPEYKLNDGSTWNKVVQAYKNYYVQSKNDFACWTRRPIPKWYEHYFVKQGFSKVEIRPGVFCMK